MEDHVQPPVTPRPKTENVCASPERVEREGRQCLEVLRSLEENRSSEKPVTGETAEKKKHQYFGNAPPSTPGNREGIWDDDDRNDWIAQSDDVEKAIESPSGARFYQHDDK